MKKSLYLSSCFVFLVISLLIVTLAYAVSCEDQGLCTLAGETCGAECNGECLSLPEAECCLLGLCKAGGTYCGHAECNGVCMTLQDAECCLSGYENCPPPTPIVPEPISSTLFIIGGAVLGFRYFWKKRKIAWKL